MKTLYYRAYEANGTTIFGNFFDTTVTTPDAKEQTSVRSIYEKNKDANNAYAFVVLDSAHIVYNTKLVPANNSSVSQISKKYRTQVFTINIDNDYIECEHQGFLDSVVTTVSKLEFAVKSASGIFKNVKRVVVDYDNYTNVAVAPATVAAPAAEWNNPSPMIYNRRIKFYSS